VRTEPWGRKERPITDVTSTALRKEGNGVMPVAYLEQTALRREHTDLLLGSGHEISNYIMAVSE
jgi:hypothetical protein